MKSGLIVFIHLIILIEGCIYLGFSIWGLVKRQCSEAVTDFANQPFLFTMDVLYLQDESCGNPNISYFAVKQPVTLKPNWKFAETLKLRTLTFLIIYTVSSSLFIILSLVCLRILHLTKNQKPIKFGVIGCWLAIVLATSGVDVVATGFYANDIAHTLSAQAYLDYIGVHTDKLTLTFLSSYGDIFVEPAATVTNICARGVLLWLFNVIGSIAAFIGMKRLPHRDFSNNGIILSNNNDINNIVVIRQDNPVEYFVQGNQNQQNNYPVVIMEKEL